MLAARTTLTLLACARPRHELARVDAGRLVHLAGPVPVRDEDAERRETARVVNELGLTPGRRVDFSGQDAITMSEQLADWRGVVAGEDFRLFHATAALVDRTLAALLAKHGSRGLAN